ncbi:MAG TPA: rhodanese-like domain-containing protein [Magnetovibrio sp.]
MDPQFKNDILLAMAVGFAIMMVFRFLPRIQAKLLGVPFVSTEEAKRMLDDHADALVLDVRTPGEFVGDLGHIEGALNLDSAQLMDKLSQLGDELEPYKHQPILITCRTHNRSPKAARILYQKGFTKLAILNNGMAGWNRAGYPVTKR